LPSPEHPRELALHSTRASSTAENNACHETAEANNVTPGSPIVLFGGKRSASTLLELLRNHRRQQDEPGYRGVEQSVIGEREEPDVTTDSRLPGVARNWPNFTTCRTGG
jgi:hypothetical protein